MSRFLYPTASSTNPVERPRPGITPATDSVPPVRNSDLTAQEQPSTIHRLGLAALAVYLVSGYATDLGLRLLHAKPYLSVVAGVVVFICFVLSGRTMFRTLANPIGKWWLFLMIWMPLTVVASRWPSGSLQLLQNYIPKNHMVFFYVGAFALTLTHCRRLFLVMAAASAVVVISCFAFGDASSGRLIIPGGIMFDNPNELALVLLIALGAFLFLVLDAGLLGKLVGGIGMLASVYYLLKTGSRGSAIAFLVVLVALTAVSPHRLKVILLGLPMVGILVMLTPSSVLHRLTLIVYDPAHEIQQENAQDNASIESQLQRQELLKQSLWYTLRYPLFGVGPGQFADAYWSDSKVKGVHVEDLGTHNTYTQISSETGVPGGVAYLVVAWMTVWTNYRLFRKTRDRRDLKSVSNLALCLFLCTLGYAVNVFFHHLGYTAYMAQLGGLTLATWLAGTRALAAAPAPAGRGHAAR